MALKRLCLAEVPEEPRRTGRAILLNYLPTLSRIRVLKFAEQFAADLFGGVSH